MLRLPARMEEILIRTAKGERGTEIARKLGISRQAVSKSLREARSRLAEIFLTLAETLYSDIVRVDLAHGYCILRNRQTNQKIYVFYIPDQGPIALLSRQINCSQHNRLCKTIVEAATKWNIVDRKENMDLQVTVDEILEKIEE